MYASELELDQDLISESEKRNKTIIYNSNFNFLKCHNGIRPNKMHLLIAPTHSGKSTLVRSLLRDFIFKNQKCNSMLWLTEETKQEFTDEFSNSVPPNDILKNLRIFSEQDWNEKDPKKIMNFIEENIEFYKIDFLILDNLTTTPIYRDRTVEHQAMITDWLKRISKKCALFIIAHSNTSDYNSRFLDENDIRGSKGITNLTEFLYILQPIMVGETLYQFVNIKKHRGQKVKNRFYQLRYSPILSAFESDIDVSFDRIAEIFQARNQLSKKVKK